MAVTGVRRICWNRDLARELAESVILAGYCAVIVATLLGSAAQVVLGQDVSGGSVMIAWAWFVGEVFGNYE